MSTLYRPVPITNLDQANALPRGSVVFDGDPEDGQTYYRSGDDWYADGHPGLMSIAVECGAPVTALVPIEAEEEWALVLDDDGSMDVAESEAEVREWVRLGDEPRPPVHRLVTPWEESR